MKEKSKELKVLRLTLRQPYYYLMEKGIKQVEIRIPTEWIKSRLYDKKGNHREYDLVEYSHGYEPNRPQFLSIYQGFTIATHKTSLPYLNIPPIPVEVGDYIIKFANILKEEPENDFEKQTKAAMRNLTQELLKTIESTALDLQAASRLPEELIKGFVAGHFTFTASAEKELIKGLSILLEKHRRKHSESKQ